MKKITIDGKLIGNGCPFYMIAEAGANHEGQIDKAFQLIDAALESPLVLTIFGSSPITKLTL